MGGKNATPLIGWHPDDPELVARFEAEVKRRGGGRGAKSAILNEALRMYLDHYGPLNAETTETEH